MRASDKVDKEFQKLWNNDFTKEVKSDDHDAIVKWLYKKLRKDDRFVRSLFCEFKIMEILDKKVSIEAPIHSPRGQSAIGFVDVSFFIKFSVELSQDQIDDNLKAEKHWKERKSNYNYSYDGETHRDWYSFLLNFEVKSKVNIGETIRQINYYKINGMSDNQLWYVCAPSFEDHDILLEQNIGFIEYKPDQV